MSRTNSLGVLTPLLSTMGERRLFEFLEVVDTPTAARFRAWLGTATEAEVKEAAGALNRSLHGREFIGWWQTRDNASGPGQSEVTQFSSSIVAQPDPQAHLEESPPGVRNAGFPFIALGYALMLVGRGVSVAGDTAAALGLLLGVAGLLFHVGGCMKLAEAKGYSKWLGLLGLLTCLGLLILLAAPDRYRTAR